MKPLPAQLEADLRECVLAELRDALATARLKHPNWGVLQREIDRVARYVRAAQAAADATSMAEAIRSDREYARKRKSEEG